MKKTSIIAAAVAAAAVVGLSFGEGDGTQVKPVPAIVVPDTVASADDTALPRMIRQLRLQIPATGRFTESSKLAANIGLPRT